MAEFARGVRLDGRGWTVTGAPRLETWAGFWGEFLLVEQHRDHPGLWTVREERAARIVRDLRLSPGARVLGLGCGDGLLEVCLARSGLDVTGVDRLERVLAIARERAGDTPVELLCADLRHLERSPDSYAAVLLLETLGLASREDDADLLARVATWLAPGGRLLLDVPREPAPDPVVHAFDVGADRLTVRSTFDPATRLQSIAPRLERAEGEVVELLDPYDPARGTGPGLLRYLWPVDELASHLRALDLVVTELEHPWSAKHLALLAQRA